MSKLPSGTVTLLFTDIEGSTRLLHELGERYADMLAEHRNVLRGVFGRHGGVEVDTQGDALFVAFARATDAVAAAAEAQDALADGPIRVRMGIHTGEPVLTEEGYVGVDVHRAARIMDAGHGGQVLLSETTASLLDSRAKLRDLGDHRLKDLSSPLRLYQLGDQAFPPPRTLYHTNLPIQPTPLIGRERELAEAASLLRRARLLTLTGVGGAGKTRLALQLATDVAADFRDGVVWVDLQTLRDARLVVPTIAQAVGAKDDSTSRLRGKQLLLLLDNFEHLLKAGTALGELLASNPDLTLLVTSREPLHLAGEQQYEVPPLPERDAVALFTERARSVTPGFEPDGRVTEICRRLDGLPLAIELAAARTKVLSPSAILQRLEKGLELLTGGTRDAPERQRTLRATIEWSYALLSDSEQEVFARLAVFAGGCTLEAAEAVCAADLDTLHSLVDKSLVRQQGERFTMLETIQEYALEVLEERGDAEELRRRHAHHFTSVAERAEPELDAPDPARWLNTLTDEAANFRAALAWSAASGDTDVHVRLATSLRVFWFARGDVTEGRAWLEGVLALRSPPHIERRLRALEGAFELVRVQGDHQRARQLADERLALSREVGDSSAIASSFHDLGLLAADEGDHERARVLYEDAVELGRRRDHKRLALWISDLGSLARWQGDLERASVLLEEALALHREAGDKAGIAYTSDELATVALHEGRLGDARALLAEGLRNWHAVGATNLIVVSLDTHAAAIAAHGEGERAARLLGAADALREAMAIRPLYQEKSESPGKLAAATARAQLGEDGFAAAFARGREMGLEQAVADALADTATTGPDLFAAQPISE